MHKMIFVNLPVADLARSREFFTAIGYTFDDRFSDDNAAALVLGDAIVAMLLRRDFFETFIPGRTAGDPTSAPTAITCLSAESRDEVNGLVDKAMAAGAAAGDTEDHGFMYGRSFYDLDGHGWEIMWMDPAAAEAGPEEYVAQQADKQ
ncbi:glyoxalase [Gordonia spumicola]|uniref:Glyoxalase n=1 Tax=Gordonia spumicola TaxID=589161 RepID=A0A7I9V3H3_9ACTN|nr:VOC family protein [Gordonia spumicola]GED99965.1 glyoxalase [Gordonia spumicola]